MRKIILLFLSLFIFSFIILAQIVIENPKKPLNKKAGIVFQLKEEMRITDEQRGFYFKNPENIKVAPDGYIFVLDEDQFIKFNSEGKFIKNIFRKGQGPGELERIENYLFSNNEIIVHQPKPNKIVKMDMEGNLIKEFRPEKTVTKLIAYFDDKYIMARHSFPKLKKSEEETEIIDIIWNILQVSENKRVEETGYAFPAKWFAKRVRTGIIANYIVDFVSTPYKKKYLVIYHTQDYLLKLLDLEKNQIVRIFNREYKSVKYKSEKTTEKKVRFTLEPPRDYYNDIQKLFIYKDKTWLMTSTMDKKKGILVDVFNIKGQYIDNFYLLLPKSIKLKNLSRHPITISGDSLFILEYDENDIPAIVKYKIIVN